MLGASTFSLGYAVIGVGSTDKDGAGGFGLEFPNNNVVNNANPTPCAHEDSRDHAYIKVTMQCCLQLQSHWLHLR